MSEPQGVAAAMQIQHITRDPKSAIEEPHDDTGSGVTAAARRGSN